LHALLTLVEENFAVHYQESKAVTLQPTEDELLVYVYLYNAKGLTFPTWQKMVHPSVFYEYSVNRPIYRDKAHVESFIRSKANKAQHGYLTLIINKAEVIKDEAALQDTVGNPLIKVKDGSLRKEKFISFTHNGAEYVIDAEGELMKKTL
ncbi:MAG: hypothetical protein EPO11_07410, partial [Gammaproteobacteria bacterium]